MELKFRVLIGCCVAIMAALLVVGAVSHGVIRHIVQTSPLWISIALGIRGSGWVKWTALPCFVFWLLMMVVIWLFLLGWTHIVSGSFSSTEIAMTGVIGLASILGIIEALRVRRSGGALAASATFLIVAVLQLAAIRLSLLQAIAHH